MPEAGKVKTIIHIQKDSRRKILFDWLNIILITGSIYLTYKRLFTPYVINSEVDWLLYRAEILTTNGSYSVRSIDDEAEAMGAYKFAFDTHEKEGKTYTRLVMKRWDKVVKIIQENKNKTV